MSAIRGKPNRDTELRLRMALVKAGVRGWKLHPEKLPGRPDFYFEKSKIAIFVRWLLLALVSKMRAYS